MPIMDGYTACQKVLKQYEVMHYTITNSRSQKQNQELNSLVEVVSQALNEVCQQMM